MVQQRPQGSLTVALQIQAALQDLTMMDTYMLQGSMVMDHNLLELVVFQFLQTPQIKINF